MEAAVARRGRPAAPFAPYHKWDRDFFLVLVLAIWIGIVMGFGGDIVRHVRSDDPAYPWIVHVHAVAFVGWLVLLTTQVLFIRTKRPQLHYRLGAAMMWLALLMVIVGPATAIAMQRLEFGTKNSDPAFLAIQLTDIIAFAGLVTAAYRTRNISSAHKRLMLLSTLYISDAGFARWLAPTIGGALGQGFWPFLASAYLPSDLLILSLGAYDLATRKRLYPAYLWGVAWVAALQLTAGYLYAVAPFWKAVATRLIGY
ncbi:MAG: hypothetical protein WDN03_05975 [Rhizomicrobium sp.]